ncbi:hypothetical protein GCM10027569_72140 [Flindersiella endophytica]
METGFKNGSLADEMLRDPGGYWNRVEEKAKVDTEEWFEREMARRAELRQSAMEAREPNESTSEKTVSVGDLWVALGKVAIAAVALIHRAAAKGLSATERRRNH